MSKLAIKGLLAITATLWLAQPVEISRSAWNGSDTAEQISDNEDAGEAPFWLSSGSGSGDEEIS